VAPSSFRVPGRVSDPVPFSPDEENLREASSSTGAGPGLFLFFSAAESGFFLLLHSLFLLPS